MSNLRIKGTLLTGILTVIPLWVTWLVFKFLINLLANIGKPLVPGFIRLIEMASPTIAAQLNSQWLLYLLALLLTVLALYFIGWLARLVIGQRILSAVEALLVRIPLVDTIYGATKQLLSVLQSKPDNVQRVVLVDFPRRDMKVVGLVTRVLEEKPGGRKMAAVYIPTTPNPTSGYLELVPVADLTPTDWTMDQAMTFIISGGAVAPDTLPASPEHGPRPEDLAPRERD